MENQYSIMQFFTYAHLPSDIQDVVKPFTDLARRLAQGHSNAPAEVAVALRKLLEAKDAAVRAVAVVN